jgi:hypothetical protein
MSTFLVPLTNVPQIFEIALGGCELHYDLPLERGTGRRLVF